MASQDSPILYFPPQPTLFLAFGYKQFEYKTQKSYHYCDKKTTPSKTIKKNLQEKERIKPAGRVVLCLEREGTI